MNGTLKSAAWPAVDAELLEEYIIIHAYYIELQKDKEFIVFDKDGKHCLQFDGMYVMLNNEPYDALKKLVQPKT